MLINNVAKTGPKFIFGPTFDALCNLLFLCESLDLYGAFERPILGPQ